MGGQKKPNEDEIPFAADNRGKQESNEWELESPFKQSAQANNEKKEPQAMNQVKVLDSKTIQSTTDPKASNGATSETQI